MSGNDFTGHYMRGALKGKIGVQGRVQIRDLAKWVHRMRRVENHDAVAREMVRKLLFIYHSVELGWLNSSPKYLEISGLIDEGDQFKGLCDIDCQWRASEEL